MEIINRLERLLLGQAALLEMRGHMKLALRLRAEVTSDALPAIITTTSVRAMFEEDLELLQNIVAKLQGQGRIHQLAEAEQLLDWFEQQVYTMQELGEEHYLTQARL